jgi:hypothetical protein
MVITSHINKWNVTRVLVDNRSQAEILFLSTFEQIGLNKNQLKESPKPLYDFRGIKIDPYAPSPYQYLLAAPPTLALST